LNDESFCMSVCPSAWTYKLGREVGHDQYITIIISRSSGQRSWS